MIFVTVGTTQWDELVREVDKLIGQGNIKEKVTVQIGAGNYIPRNCDWFRYAPSLDQHIKRADIVIAQGGAGFVFEALSTGAKLICVENRQLSGRHQREILNKLSKSLYLVWCKDIVDLGVCVNRMRKIKLRRYSAPACEIHKKIVEFMG